MRLATPADATGCAAIYDPICRDTGISFETDPPGEAEMARRIAATTERLPWLVCEQYGVILGYAYAGRYRERPAYRWTVETSVYVAEHARGRGVARALYTALLAILSAMEYRNAVAGIALPNPGSVALHEAMGFRRVGVYPSLGYKLGTWRDVSRWSFPLVREASEPSEPTGVASMATSAAWAEAIAAGASHLIALEKPWTPGFNAVKAFSCEPPAQAEGSSSPPDTATLPLIRAGGLAERAGCLELARALPAFFDTAGLQTMEQDLSRHQVMVAHRAERLVGFLSWQRKGERVAEITWMAVDPRERGRGVGKALVRAVTAALKPQGVSLLEVKTLSPGVDYPPYEATRKFYEAVGFTLLEVIDPYPAWGPGNPCAIYVRVL